jgi:hypothetical protein
MISGIALRGCQAVRRGKFADPVEHVGKSF